MNCRRRILDRSRIREPIAAALQRIGSQTALAAPHESVHGRFCCKSGKIGGGKNRRESRYEGKALLASIATLVRKSLVA
jgi:hypothetical protein